jgi:hypothetical protein
LRQEHVESRKVRELGLAALLLLSLDRAPAFGQPALSRTCTDVAGTSRPTFEGRLIHQVFPGPPNYEDVRKGDSPEPEFILKLFNKRCVRGSGSEEMELEPTDIDRLHIITNVEGEVRTEWRDLRRFIDRDVAIVGRDGFAAYTAHHRAPVVITLVSIRAIDDSFTAYGTPQTTVEAFYQALGAGNGAAAAAMMVPGKRSGPYAPGALSAFYGSLSEPLRLVGVTQVAPNVYKARYAYVAGKRRCEGESAVKTVQIEGLNLIQSIQAAKGC